MRNTSGRLSKMTFVWKPTSGINARSWVAIPQTNQSAIGNIRLITLENGVTPTLPIEEHYKVAFDFNSLPIANLRQSKTGEIFEWLFFPLSGVDRWTMIISMRRA